MDAAALGALLGTAFPADVAWAVRSPKRLWVDVPAPRLREVVAWLRSSVPGTRLGTSTGIDLREGLGVFHHLAVNGSPLVVTLKVVAPKSDPRVPSLASTQPAARWIEREIHDLLGVTFEGHPDPRRLLKARAFSDGVLPLRRDFDPRRPEEASPELDPPWPT